MQLLVFFDIATIDKRDRKRYRQVVAVCKAYGIRVQKSVFWCDLIPQQFPRLIDRLRKIVDAKRDAIHFVIQRGISKNCGRTSLLNPEDKVWIIED